MTEPSLGTPSPLSVTVAVTPDDWGAVLTRASQPLLDRRRRRLLTVLLPLIWFLTLLGAISTWQADTQTKTLTAFANDIGGLIWGPTGLLLAVATLFIASLYSLHPWLIERRVQAWLRREGIRDTVLAHYTFDETAIVSEEPDQRSVYDWSGIVRLEESNDHLFLVCDFEIVMVLPKRDLSLEDRADIVARARRLIATADLEATPVATTDLDPQPGAVVLRYDQTLADRTAATLETMRTPAARRARNRGFVTFAVVASLLVPSFYVFAWSIDPFRLPLSISVPLFVEMFGTTFWQPALAAAGVMALIALCTPWIERRLAAQYARHQFAGRDSAPVTLVISEAGVAARAAGVENRIGWPAFKRVWQRSEHIFMAMRRGSVLILPLRALDAAQLAKVLAFARNVSGEPQASREGGGR